MAFKANEVGRVCGTHEDRKFYKVLIGKPEEKRPLGRPRRKWEDRIRMGKLVGGVDWIRLAQDRDRWRGDEPSGS
jgi:hypothetical protein